MKSLVHILLIEDSIEDAEQIERTLKKFNGYQYDIKRVDTMKEVIEALNESSWDLIVCDYSLPSFDAMAVIRLLDEQQLDIHLVLISGVASDDLVRKALALGADDYISKNNIRDLIHVIRRVIRLSTAYDEILKAFVTALSFRDNETAGHSERVVDLTKQLAHHMGLFMTDIVHIGRGALLHDIGKFGIGDEILLKKGPLTEDEFTRMKMHPIIGKELLSRIPFLKRAVEIPHYHHERWNGSGYPYGLTGHNIPLSARMFAVVDVYDAMTSERSYREALSKEFVLKYIDSQSGTLFDPDVVKKFLEMMEAP